MYVRFPAAVKADLQDAALEHGISLNEEVLRRLTAPPRRPRTIRQRLMELRPYAEDPDIPIEWLTSEMERINPYRPGGSHANAEV